MNDTAQTEEKRGTKGIRASRAKKASQRAEEEADKLSFNCLSAVDGGEKKYGPRTSDS